MKPSYATGGNTSIPVADQGGSVPTLRDRLRLRRIFVGPDVAFDSGEGAASADAPSSATFQLIDQLQFVNALVAIFAGNTPEALRMKSQIEDVGGTVMLVSQLDLPQAWLRAYAPRLTCCIVGHDFADLATASEFCLLLRQITPDLPIVLTIPGTDTHDFSTTLRPICDARLRRPVSRTPLLLGIQAACDNRAAYASDLCPAGTTGAALSRHQSLADVRKH